MLEVMIERWTERSGRVDFRWSLWHDGRRLAMGAEPHATADDSVTEATSHCRHILGREPDCVTRL